MSTTTRVLLAAAGLTVLSGCVASPPGSGPSASPTTTVTATTSAAPPVTVVRVVDGDTLITTQAGTETTIRVLAIDTPETVKPGTPVQCGGREASDHAKTLLPAGTPVTLTPDPTQDNTDRYGRQLRYVTVAGQDFGRSMINAGLAHAYKLKTGKPPQKYAEYAAAEAAAKTAHTGPLATCTP